MRFTKLVERAFVVDHELTGDRGPCPRIGWTKHSRYSGTNQGRLPSCPHIVLDFEIEEGCLTCSHDDGQHQHADEKMTWLHFDSILTSALTKYAGHVGGRDFLVKATFRTIARSPLVGTTEMFNRTFVDAFERSRVIQTFVFETRIYTRA